MRSEKVDGKYVSTITLCMVAKAAPELPGGVAVPVVPPREGEIAPLKEGVMLEREVSGEPHEERKLAEQLAAKALLAAIAPEQLEKAAAAKQKEAAAPPAPKASQHSDPKTQLNQLLMRLLHRSLTKTDVKYTLVPVANGFQAQCELVFRGEVYAGEVCETKKEAELAVAEQVLKHLQ